jgi:hypothetical protein
MMDTSCFGPANGPIRSANAPMQASTSYGDGSHPSISAASDLRDCLIIKSLSFVQLAVHPYAAGHAESVFAGDGGEGEVFCGSG